MALDTSKFAKLSPGANSNIPQLFGYSTGDVITLPDDAGYFNAKRDDLNPGDLVYVYSTAAGAHLLLKVVTSPKSPLTTNVTTAAAFTAL